MQVSNSGMKRLIVCFVVFAFLVFLAGCAPQEALPQETPSDEIEEATGETAAETIKEIPVAEVDETSMFGVDKNINVGNIDEWLGRDDVVFIDVRMPIDPADFEAIGIDPVLSGTVEGFEVVPRPLLANMTGLPEPVEATKYSGPTLFTLTWDEEGNIDTVTPNYRESKMVINDLFPVDKPIFLMCGAGGYAGMTKALLLKLGYNPDLLFNLGGFIDYKGNNAINIKVQYDGNEYNALHRLKYHIIDFEQLHAN